MQFVTLEELPAVIDALRDKLQSRGFHVKADRLDQLVHHMAWITSSESYGERLLALKGIRKDQRRLPPDVAPETGRLSKGIDRICGGDNFVFD
ncbi:MAG TPA: hypothetical protein VM717_07860 [Chthoniobacterales bacterium]|jgi:hypothetical protein|nr:hypothetical protein [Chthoniobacterales bacterium]